MTLHYSEFAATPGIDRTASAVPLTVLPLPLEKHRPTIETKLETL